MQQQLPECLNEQLLNLFLESVGHNEKQTRLFAGWLGLALGKGYFKKIAEVTKLSINTVRAGMKELRELLNEEPRPANNRVRREGGGRKPTEVKQPGITTTIEKII